jgi:hypothetical protein
VKLRQKLHSKDGYEFVISCNHFALQALHHIGEFNSLRTRFGFNSGRALKFWGICKKDWIVNLPATNRSLVASATEGSVSLKKVKMLSKSRPTST